MNRIGEEIERVAHPLMMYLRKHNILGTISILGMFYAIKTVTKCISTFSKYFLRPQRDLLKRYGLSAWAVITGGSEGIGAGYAQTLAKMGFNIFIIARGREALQQRATQIMLEYPNIQVKYLTFDFSLPFSIEDYAPLTKALGSIDIGLLVNNVGLYGASDFHKLPTQWMQKMINVNIIAPTYLTRLLLPKMLLRGDRSGVIFICNSCNNGLWPFIPIYSAQSAYKIALSKSLTVEFGYKIDILAVIAGNITTQGNQHIGKYFLDGSTAGSHHLRHLGYSTVDPGHWKHWVEQRVLGAKGNALLRWNMASVLKDVYMKKVIYIYIYI